MPLGGLDKRRHAFAKVNDAFIGIAGDAGLGEHRRRGVDEADDLEMAEGVAQPVDRGGFAREQRGAFLRRQQRRRRRRRPRARPTSA